MQLTPRYGTDPVITLDGSPADVAAPAIRQRRRLAGIVAEFDEGQWTQPSRCAGWSNRDVIAHLDGTNNFWTMSITAGLRGEPTRFLATFDPVATPAQMVEAASDVSTATILERFSASTEALTDLLGSLSSDDWATLGESPPGHVSISTVVHHALWDSWVHERDIVVPLGEVPAVEADEVAACLRYVAALTPAFAAARGKSQAGLLAVDAVDPDTAFVVDIGDHVVVRSGRAAADLTLTGSAVELLEAFSVRAPWPQPLPADTAWMVRGLTEIFDQA